MVVRAGLAHCVRPCGLTLKRAPSTPASGLRLPRLKADKTEPEGNRNNQRLVLHPALTIKKPAPRSGF